MSRTLATLVAVSLTVFQARPSYSEPPLATTQSASYDDASKHPEKYVGKRVSWTGRVSGSWHGGDETGWDYLLLAPSDQTLRPFRVLEPSKSTEAAEKAGFNFGDVFLVTGTVKQFVDIEIATGPSTRQAYRAPVLADATLDVVPVKP